MSTNPDLDLRTSKRLWVIAAVTAVGLHLGGAALALTNLRGDDGEGLGAAGAEYAVELASATDEDNPAPPGPEDRAQEASPEMTQQKAEVKETDLPQAKPTETEEADRIVTEDNSKKPTEEEAQVAKVQTETSEAAEKHQDQSPTKLEDARQSETTKAPNPGIGKDKLLLTAQWGKKISAYLDLHKKFPENGKAKAAKVKIALVLNRVGKVLSVAVMESSGDAAFDDAAISMVHRSDPVPAPPAALPEDQFSFSLDVNYNKPKK
ncbi:energy transducer TonB [Bradyrhizobium brasilense]|uniref:Outer membrane transport energization protein TonB n=1 Tax=Bradyrhizobium brasilense TaxID=1419277 RepID=A0A1G7C4T5_9BRAD|nr:TonB family protein [Bradyrhizobium brasilense]MCC8972757.1 TonB family protein [Bradyrhizobium brasilense]SDE34321.1 outer membrane transport energization protein TonB [Bradyrhizobium brasilense]